MNSLARNSVLLLKNVHGSRTIAMLVHQRPIQNLQSDKIRQQIRIQSKYPVTNVQCSWLALQSATFSSDTSTLSQLDYERCCVETLDGLNDYIEELVESVNGLDSADVVNKDGVLTVSLGAQHGIYVINKQSPNKQIWLSSPTSGPKRFDFVYASDGSKNGYWIYKHTGETLHEILDKEFTKITQTQTQFHTLAFGSRS